MDHGNAAQSLPALRVLYVGTAGELSRGPLLALLAAGCDVCGVLVPSEDLRVPLARLVPEPVRSALPLANPYVSPGLVQIAWQHDIPAFAVGRLGDPFVAAGLAELCPDVACVVCFPRRIPPSLLEVPPRGWLNVHPSLLPAHRGPAPLFWAFRSGERTTGVTVHFMDESFDTGDIVAQAPLVLPEGIRGAEVDRLCAALGGDLLLASLRGMQAQALERHAQPPGGMSEGWPTPSDWSISTGWTARRASNFMRATDDWGYAYLVEAGTERLLLESAVGYLPDAQLGAPYLRAGRTVEIQFNPGVLRARLAA
jgi:methionyl-tRNA formyltransferase